MPESHDIFRNRVAPYLDEGESLSPLPQVPDLSAKAWLDLSEMEFEDIGDQMRANTWKVIQTLAEHGDSDAIEFLQERQNLELHAYATQKDVKGDPNYNNENVAMTGALNKVPGFRAANLANIERRIDLRGKIKELRKSLKLPKFTPRKAFKQEA